MKFSKDYIQDIIGKTLKQGTTPKKLAITCALGAVIGIFPIMGTTTMICFAIAIFFQLNVPIIQLANYLVTALQVILIFPFIKAGIYVFHLKPFAYTKDQFIDQFQNNFWPLLKESGAVIAAGIGMWLLAAIPLFFMLYFLFFFLFKKWTRNAPSPTA
ncbi:MAG TPA: DUF2062 domain-containing protein [Cyclobacteriaceae bacterium]